MNSRALFLTICIYLITIITVIKADAISLNNISDYEQERTKSFNVNKGGKLYVNVRPGNVKIHTWRKNEALLKLRGIDDKELNNVEATLSRNTLIVEYHPGWSWDDAAEFLITIPSQFSIEIKTSGGNVEINSDIEGDVEINSMGGNINTMNINGNVKLSTLGGNIKVGNVNGGLFINTMGGNIDVGKIKGENAKVNTMSGDITIDNISSSNVQVMTYGGIISINEINGNASVETMGGNIEILNLKGKLKMETKGGSLKIKKGNGSLSAITYGGDIELLNIYGDVNAKTLSGNINAEINPALNTTSRFYTQNGEVEITLPSWARTDIEAEIKAWGNKKFVKDFYKIQSDFPVKEFFNDNTIKGIYSINGGGSKIYISTKNGNIKISKKR